MRLPRVLARAVSLVFFSVFIIGVYGIVPRSANSLHMGGADNMALVSLHTLLSAASAPSRMPSKLARVDKPHHVPAKEAALTGNCSLSLFNLDLTNAE